MQAVWSEFVTQLANAGLWWAALLAALLGALIVVAVRNGWIKVTAAPPEQRDDVDRREVPDAEWGSGIEPDDHPPG